jgi:hypothetical protein
MPTLLEVTSLPQFQACSTAQQMLDLGNVTQSVSGDSTAYTWSGIGAKLIVNGVSASSVINLAANIGTLPGGPMLAACLSSGGFNFADATNRALIQSLEVTEPQWAVDMLNAMLAIGAPQNVTIWQLLGVEQPTLAELQKIILNRVRGEAFVALDPLIASGTITSVADMITQVTAILTSVAPSVGG